MKVAHYTKTPAETVEHGATGVTIREVITPADGAPRFSMRVFEVAPGGSTPRHGHAWEHEVYVAAGRGVVWSAESADHPISEGDTIFVPGGEEHQFRNDSDELFRFVCLIPNPS